MNSIRLTKDVIDKVRIEAVPEVHDALGDDLEEIILYGSCSRGDYNKDSDIDIAILTGCDRLEAKKYSDKLDDIATGLAMKYLAIVNFVCLPQKEFEEKKSWYPYFKNIEREGERLYGRQVL